MGRFDEKKRLDEGRPAVRRPGEKGPGYKKKFDGGGVHKEIKDEKTVKAAKEQLQKRLSTGPAPKKEEHKKKRKADSGGEAPQAKKPKKE